MKKEIHPDDYRLVVFQDISCDYTFITRSTVKTSDTIKWEDGKEYPLYKLEISDRSHPYFTGKQNLVDSAGRIEKFNRKYKISAEPAEAVQVSGEDPAVEKTEPAEAVQVSGEAPADEKVEPVEETQVSEEAPADKEKKD